MEKHLCVGSLPKESDAQAMPQLNKAHMIQRRAAREIRISDLASTMMRSHSTSTSSLELQAPLPHADGKEQGKL